ncbi:hypothetical protein FJZ17_04315 [Candidatus Pacearchaeota archaeon]|nr:hypothetical protein [Candidatus Pacearchaeota archaeon]
MAFEIPSTRPSVPFLVDGKPNRLLLPVEIVSTHEEARRTGRVQLRSVPEAQVHLKRMNGRVAYLGKNAEVIYVCTPEDFGKFAEAERRFLGLKVRLPRIVWDDNEMGNCKPEYCFDPYNLRQFYGKSVVTRNSNYRVLGKDQDGATGGFESYTLHGHQDIEGTEVLAIAAQTPGVIDLFLARSHEYEFAERLIRSSGLQPREPKKELKLAPLNLVVAFAEPNRVGTNYLITSDIKGIL